MRRRSFLLFLVVFPLAASCDPATDAPTDPDKMNDFADHYNRYAKSLKDFVDLKEWKRVVERWHSLR